MDPQISDKIHVTVTDILNSSDNVDLLTELQVRQLASKKLNIDLSPLTFKILIRQIIEAFLLSTSENGAVLSPLDEYERKPVVTPQSCPVNEVSQQKEVTVRSNGGELPTKVGTVKENETANANGTSLLSNFQKSNHVSEEAIAKETRPRSEFENKQASDKHDSSANRSKQNGAEPINKDGVRHRPRLVATKEPTAATGAPTLAPTPQRLVPMEIIRFDGKNYQQWADRMESYLKQWKIAYVLSEPCPSAVGVVDRELGQTLAAAEKWMNDDHICRQNILNSLCDNLFRLYFNYSGTAKDLWEELKLIYLHEEHGANVTLVRKYIEFQIIEEKSIFEQVHEFNQIVDELIANGMFVEEKFHVNFVISKLPASWKPYSIKLMKEDRLPVWMLMNHLKAEEAALLKGNKSETLIPQADLSQPSKNLGPHRMSMKRPGVFHSHHEADRDKKFKFCGICKKRGHNPEQCWFRDSGGKDTANEKDTTNEKDQLPSKNAVVREDTNGAVGHNTT